MISYGVTDPIYLVDITRNIRQLRITKNDITNER